MSPEITPQSTIVHGASGTPWRLLTGRFPTQAAIPRMSLESAEIDATSKVLLRVIYCRRLRSLLPSACSTSKPLTTCANATFFVSSHS